MERDLDKYQKHPENTSDATHEVFLFGHKLSPEQNAFLRHASRYIWWKTPCESLAYPHRIISQVMNIGTWDDLCRLSCLFSPEMLRDVLNHSEAGQFSAKSWHFWQYRLNRATVATVPPLPRRILEDGATPRTY